MKKRLDYLYAFIGGLYIGSSSYESHLWFSFILIGYILYRVFEKNET